MKIRGYAGSGYLVIITPVVNLRSVLIRHFQAATVTAFPVYHRFGKAFHLAFQCRRILVSHEYHLVAYTNEWRNWNAIDYQFYPHLCLPIRTKLVLSELHYIIISKPRKYSCVLPRGYMRNFSKIFKTHLSSMAFLHSQWNILSVI